MIKLNHLSFVYHKKKVIGDLTLTFPDSKITAVVGPNGCGKSTLLKLCAGLLTPVSGSVLLDRSEILCLSSRQRAREIAILFQSRPLIHLTARQTVLSGREPYRHMGRDYTLQDKAIAADAMRAAGCLELSDKELHCLSGGERQRVYLAAAIAQETPYLLLDEPTNALDIHAALEFMELTASMQRQHGKTIVIVLHDLDLALRYADRILVIKEGQMLAMGTPKEILDSKILEQAFEIQICQLGKPERSFYGFSLKP